MSKERSSWLPYICLVLGNLVSFPKMDAEIMQNFDSFKGSHDNFHWLSLNSPKWLNVEEFQEYAQQGCSAQSMAGFKWGPVTIIINIIKHKTIEWSTAYNIIKELNELKMNISN